MKKRHLQNFKTTSGETISVFVSQTRNYGRCTFYTWLFATRENGSLIEGWTHDPWPMSTPPKSGILWSLRTIPGIETAPDRSAIKWLRDSISNKLCTHALPHDVATYCADLLEPPATHSALDLFAA